MADPDPPDLTTKDGVVKHLTARIRKLVKDDFHDDIDNPHPQIVRAAKEVANSELFAELFKRIKALEPSRDGWECLACGVSIRVGPGFCSEACTLAFCKARELHSS